MVVDFPHVHQSKYFMFFVRVNDHHSDVIVTTDISGQIEFDNFKPTETVLKTKKWVTKKFVTVSTIEVSGNLTIDINGHSVLHLKPTTKELMPMTFLRIKVKNSIFRCLQSSWLSHILTYMCLYWP